MYPLTPQTLEIAGHRLQLDLPSDPDQVLTDSACATNADDPYWSILWPTAKRTAECVLRHNWPPGKSALELGCGCGLVGIAGLLAGLQVTFSDIVPDAVNLALHNSQKNGFPDANGQTLDWSKPTDDRFDVLLASDLLYESGQHLPLLKFIKRTLSPEGKCYIGDPGRQNAGQFYNSALEQGWQIELLDSNLNAVSALTPGVFCLLVLFLKAPKF
ncbi:MAG: methyltransferase domain-containing protein [Fuerstiella sp.]